MPNLPKNREIPGANPNAAKFKRIYVFKGSSIEEMIEKGQRFFAAEDFASALEVYTHAIDHITQVIQLNCPLLVAGRDS